MVNVLAEEQIRTDMGTAGANLPRIAGDARKKFGGFD
jgi:hypothetical protein